MGDRTRETRDKRWDLRYKRRETGDTSRETRYGRWETQWGGDKGTPNLFNVRNSRHITRRRAILKKLPVARLRHVSDLCFCVSDAVTRWRVNVNQDAGVQFWWWPPSDRLCDAKTCLPMYHERVCQYLRCCGPYRDLLEPWTCALYDCKEVRMTASRWWYSRPTTST